MPRRPRAGRAPISGVALVLALIVTLLTSAPATAATGTLSGTLSGPDGNPYESFKVEVYAADGPDRWQLVASRTVWQSDTVLPPGEFSVPLPAGTYRACFGAPDGMWWEDVGRRCWSDGYDVWGATDIDVAEGGTTTITPTLPPEARLRGRVVGAGGVGVSAYVAPYRRMPDGTWSWIGGGAQSLADGRFVVPDLDPGTYRFCLLDVPREFLPECWDDVATLAEAQELDLAPASITAIYVRLAPRASVSGTVARPPGSTASLGVIAYRLQDGRWQYTAADTVGDDGGYRIVGLDPGAYRVCVSGYDVVTACWRHGSKPADARDVVLAASQQRTGIDLAPGPAGFVEGTLPEMYLGAQGYPNVTAWLRVGDTWEAVAFGESVPVGIGSDWTYAIGSLPSGTYVVCVDHQEPEFVPAFPHTCNGGSPTPQGGEPFEVVAGATTTGIDIATGQAGEIRGRVNGATPLRVDLYMPSGRLATTQTTDPDGYYRFREIPSGSYYVGFHRETAASGLAAEWWRNKGDGAGLAGATPVPVDAAIVSGISATLDPGGTIVGRLVDAAGDPVAGCQLRARARDHTLAARRTVTDAEGDFAIGGLSTASYLVLVTRACSGAAAGIYYDADSPTRTTAQVRDADPVAVVRGQSTSLAGDLATAAP